MGSTSDRQGGMGNCCKLPHWALRQSSSAFREYKGPNLRESFIVLFTVLTIITMQTNTTVVETSEGLVCAPE